jgi:hypothetical protein
VGSGTRPTQKHLKKKKKKKNLNKYKYFLPYLTDCVILRANKYKVMENALTRMLLKLIVERV